MVSSFVHVVVGLLLLVAQAHASEEQSSMNSPLKDMPEGRMCLRYDILDYKSSNPEESRDWTSFKLDGCNSVFLPKLPLKDDGARHSVDATNAAKKLMSPLSRAHCAGGLAGKTGVVGAMGKSASAPALGHILRSTWVPRQPSSASRVADDAAVAARGGTRAAGQRKAQPTMPDEGFYMHMPGLMPPVFLENLDTRELNA